jgi:prepilin peptidase CpaA
MEMWAIATFSLIAGMVDDLRSRKVHNGLFLTLLPAILAANFYFRGVDGMMIGVLAFVVALVLTIPMHSMNILGGGDVKLFAAFALCVDSSSVFATLVYSVLWGGLFALTRATLQRELLSLVRATYKQVRRTRREPAQQVYKIPYTFALLLGWFTQLTLLRAGGGL